MSNTYLITCERSIGYCMVVLKSRIAPPNAPYATDVKFNHLPRKCVIYHPLVLPMLVFHSSTWVWTMLVHFLSVLVVTESRSVIYMLVYMSTHASRPSQGSSQPRSRFVYNGLVTFSIPSWKPCPYLERQRYELCWPGTRVEGVIARNRSETSC